MKLSRVRAPRAFGARCARLTMCVVSALAFSTLASAAMSGESLRVHVPFSFVVGGQEFTAGEYQVVQSDSGIILVQGEGKAAMAMSIPAGLPKPGSSPNLRFTSSDQKEYLVGVEGETASRAIPLHVYEQRKLTATR
jgi:hypothetical protein